MTAARLGYQPALDGIRAVAIASVVGFHVFDYPRDGFLGVDLFFALSGFLITTLLVEEFGQQGAVSLRAFYRRRALRLLPALFILLAVYLVIAIGKALSDGNIHSLKRSILGVAAGAGYVSNFMLAAHGVTGIVQPVNHLWSLAAEEQFYFLWPPVLFLVLRGRSTVAFVVVSGAIAYLTLHEIELHHAGVPGYRIDFAPDTRSVSILVGCLAGLAFRSPARTSIERLTRWIEPLALLAFLGFVFEDLGLRLHSGLLTVYGVIGAILIIRATVPGSPIQKVLSVRPLVFLGKISYSLYLWHIPVLAALRVDTASRFAAGGPVRKVVALALAVFAACLSYYLVELPFLRKKRERPDGRPISSEPATMPAG
jgi:peptidoglycan/LPS O-acetylase OafA/YrhL